MWWEFHRLLDLTPSSSSTRTTRSACSSPSGPVDDESEGQADLALRFPAQDYDLGRGDGLRPGQQAGAPERLAVQVGRSARWPRSTPRTGPWTSERIVSEPASARPSSRSTGSGPRTTRRRSSSSASGSPTTGSRRPGRTAPARDLLFGLPPRVGQWLDEALRRARRDRPRGRPPARARARPHDPRDPGTAGLGQDLHRGADDLLAARRRQAGRDHRHQPQGHRQPADGGPRGRRDQERRRRPAGPEGRDQEQMLVDDSGDARQGRRRCPRPARRRPREPRRRHLVAVGVGEDDRGRRRPVRRRGGPDLARQRHRRWRAATDSLVLLGDPQQLDQPLKGTHPDGADRSALAHVLGRRRHDAADARASSSNGPGGSIRTCATSPRRSSTTTGSSPSRTSSSSASTAGPTIADGTGPRLLDVADRRRRQRVAASRRTPSPTSRGRIVEGGSTLGERAGRGASGRLGRRPDRRPVQRPGRRDQAAPAGARPASGPSTSSRARRRRSASTR